MTSSKLLIVISLVSFYVVTSVKAQEMKPLQNASAPAITVAGSADRVRFTAPNTVVQMHLQVYDNGGQLVFDVTSKGNVLDWTLQDAGGVRLDFGSYVSVVTVKSLTGKLSQRVGSVSVAEKQIELQRVDAGQMTVGQQQAVGPIEDNSALTILKAGEAEAATVVAHDGIRGQINRSRGALSFRLGDFYSGQDKEQMRLTEEGNLGIGTGSPKAKLDVAGVIRTNEGIEFANEADGTSVKLTTTAAGSLQQTLGDGTVVPNASGTGTQDRVAKWIDNAGTLADSNLRDVGGLIGLGATPATNLHLNQPLGAGTSKGLFLSGDEFFQSGNGTNNTGVLLLLGVNRPGNRQLWIGDRGNLGSSTGGFFRIQSGIFNSMDAVTGNGLTRLPLNLGTVTSNIGVGFDDFNAGGPGSKLSVAGNLTVGTGFKLAAAPADGLVVQGDVGIGTNEPQARLHVSHPFRGLRVETELAGGTVASFGGNGDFQIDAPGNAGGRFLVQNNGDVGIGLEPGFIPFPRLHHKLHVLDSLNRGLRVANKSTGGTVASFGGSGEFQVDAPGVVGGRFTIKESGNVGIGTTAPGSNLHVKVPSSGTPVSAMTIDVESFQTFGNAEASHYFRVRDIGSGSAPAFLIRGDGNVGISTDTPAARLQVQHGHIYVGSAGNGIILKSPNGAVCRRFTIDNAGNLINEPFPCP